MCNDNRSHAKEMVISVTFKYIISLPFASLVSLWLPNGSQMDLGSLIPAEAITLSLGKKLLIS